MTDLLTDFWIRYHIAPDGAGVVGLVALIVTLAFVAVCPWRVRR